MDTLDEQYCTQIVMSSSGLGREPIMWVVRLPTSFMLSRLDRAGVLTPLELLKRAGIDLKGGQRVAWVDDNYDLRETNH